jgi:hypothetical protein
MEKINSHMYRHIKLPSDHQMIRVLIRKMFRNILRVGINNDYIASN